MSGFSRDLVEISIKDVIISLNRAIASGKVVELAFTSVGKLIIMNSRVKFKFYKNFIGELENANHILENMKNRPNTADSVMTERPASKVVSVKLPEINKSSSRNSFCSDTNSANVMKCSSLEKIDEDIEPKQEAIAENQENREDNLEDIKSKFDQFPKPMVDSEPIPITVDELESMEKEMKCTNSIQARNSSQPLPIENSILTGNQMADDCMPDIGMVMDDSNQSSDEPQTPKLMGGLSCSSGSNRSPLPAPKPPLSHLSRSSSVSSGNAGRLGAQLAVEPDIGSSLSPKAPGKPVSRSSSLSKSCKHQTAINNRTHDLCYLCHQREFRNVPVNLDGERKDRDVKEDHYLTELQRIRNEHESIKEKEAIVARKNCAKEVARFNLEAAEIRKVKNNQVDDNSYESYILKFRPNTPEKALKQNELSSWLDEQVRIRKEREEMDLRKDVEIQLKERRELVDQIVKKKAEVWNKKVSDKEKYQKALDSQLCAKPIYLPKLIPDSDKPIFGSNERTFDDIYRRYMHSKEIQEEAYEKIRKRDESILLDMQKERKMEEELIKKVKHGLQQDMAEQSRINYEKRKHLETEWLHASKTKKEREIAKRIIDVTPPSHQLKLLHDQCKNYRRCGQCKRKLDNVGTSNLLKDTFYIPGARFIC